MLIFDDGTSSVAIDVGEMPAMVVPFVHPDTQRFVASVALTRPDGRAFRAEPSGQLFTNGDDVWEFNHGN